MTRQIFAKTSYNRRREVEKPKEVYLYLTRAKKIKIVENLNELSKVICDLLREDDSEEILITKSLYKIFNEI